MVSTIAPWIHPNFTDILPKILSDVSLVISLQILPGIRPWRNISSNFLKDSSKDSREISLSGGDFSRNSCTNYVRNSSGSSSTYFVRNSSRILSKFIIRNIALDYFRNLFKNYTKNIFLKFQQEFLLTF